MKVAVAMSGGVDSSVAAGLRGAGLRCPGSFIAHVGRQCRAARLLGPSRREGGRGGVRHTSYADRFARPICRYGGKTVRRRLPPRAHTNPCVACNRDFKFGTLLKWAKERRLDYVATGHYARIVREEGTGGYLFSAARIAPGSVLFSLRAQSRPAGSFVVPAR